jgi:hypothetical protein
MMENGLGPKEIQAQCSIQREKKFGTIIHTEWHVYAAQHESHQIFKDPFGIFPKECQQISHPLTLIVIANGGMEIASIVIVVV